jgi:phytoene/squalene synthetase
MSQVAELASGKGAKDENFPVASFLLKPDHRAPIMAFYRFARAADDIADHASASPDEKLALLGQMRRGLDGAKDGAAEGLALRDVMAERCLDPIHAHELLDAFEQDATVHRYETWAELMAYCRLSAMPVGRYVLDVHGEDGRIAQRIITRWTGSIFPPKPLPRRVRRSRISPRQLPHRG